MYTTKQLEERPYLENVWLAPIQDLVPTEKLRHPLSVETYQALFQTGWPAEVPPIAVLVYNQRREDGSLFEELNVYNGHHRLVAATLAGLKEIPVINWRKAVEEGFDDEYLEHVREFRKYNRKRKKQLNGLPSRKPAWLRYKPKP